MIELRYRAGLAYPPPAVFGALTDVVRYPHWQSDVAAAVVRGGVPLPAEAMAAMLTYQMMGVLDGLRSHLVSTSGAGLASLGPACPAISRLLAETS